MSLLSLGANQEFRSTISQALAGLYPIPAEWPAKDDRKKIAAVLSDKFPVLQAAVTEFREALPRRKRAGFDAAWRLYRTGSSEGSYREQDYWQYQPTHEVTIESGKRYVHDNRLTYQSNFKSNVDWLLSFAKETS